MPRSGPITKSTSVPEGTYREGVEAAIKRMREIADDCDAECCRNLQLAIACVGRLLEPSP